MAELAMLTLAIVSQCKLAAPIACAKDFGPTVMQPDVGFNVLINTL